MKDIGMSTLKIQQARFKRVVKNIMKSRKHKQIILVVSLCVCTIVPVWAVSSTAVAPSYNDTYIIDESTVFSSHEKVETMAIEFIAANGIGIFEEYVQEYTSYTKVETRAIEFIYTHGIGSSEKYIQEDTSYIKVAARAIEFIYSHGISTSEEYIQEDTSYTKVEARAIEFIYSRNIDIFGEYSQEYIQENIWARYTHQPMLEPWVPYVIMKEPWVHFMVPQPYEPYETIIAHGPFIRTEARCYFKTWMDWRTITSRNSRQWQLQQIAYTCEDGFRRIDGMYMIALGSYYLHHGVGDVFEITLSGGLTFRAVVGDVKSDLHTDPTNRFQRYDGSVIEFIIDRRVIDREVLRMGNVSSTGFNGRIVSIVRLPELFVSGLPAPAVIPEPTPSRYEPAVYAPQESVQQQDQDSTPMIDDAPLYDQEYAPADTSLSDNNVEPVPDDTPPPYTDLISTQENNPLPGDDAAHMSQDASPYSQNVQSRRIGS